MRTGPSEFSGTSYRRTQPHPTAPAASPPEIERGLSTQVLFIGSDRSKNGVTPNARISNTADTPAYLAILGHLRTSSIPGAVSAISRELPTLPEATVSTTPNRRLHRQTTRQSPRNDLHPASSKSSDPHQRRVRGQEPPTANLIQLHHERRARPNIPVRLTIAPARLFPSTSISISPSCPSTDDCIPSQGQGRARDRPRPIPTTCTLPYGSALG